ncbi:MAG: TrkH family potassium uptake protein [Syntrophobacteraceae bacterium]
MGRKTKTYAIVLGHCGPILIAMGWCLLVPLAFVVGCDEYKQGYSTTLAFVVPSGVAFLIGYLLKRAFSGHNPNVPQAALICSLGWLLCSAIGAVPFVLGIQGTYLDGYFEAMSGFTTTGITVFTGLDSMPRSILFWRALTQWVGGLGILTMFLAANPGGSSHQLFGAEGHKIDVDRPVPGLVNTIRILLGIYCLFTVVIVLGLWVLGMPLFDSVCHSFAALATGGYSPHDASIEFYRLNGYANYIWLEYVTILGMILGGMNFVVHYRFLTVTRKAWFDNTEARTWWGIIVTFVLLIVLERVFRVVPLVRTMAEGTSLWVRMEEEFRIALFQVVSILTTTGFATRDIGTSYFGEAARQIFLLLMVIGGCVGSTGGGIKVLRVAILIKLVGREVFCLRTPPNTIAFVMIDGEPVSVEEIQRVATIFFAWMVLLAFGGGVTEFFSDLNGYQAFSGMFSALGNVGPCYFSVDTMASLHPIIKITYILGMLAGRLEILPLLLLFSRKAWRN